MSSTNKGSKYYNLRKILNPPLNNDEIDHYQDVHDNVTKYNVQQRIIDSNSISNNNKNILPHSNFNIYNNLPVDVN